MRHLPFDRPGRFYRGNLHTHSTVSDGMLDPVDVVRRYREQGYDFLAITDHFMESFGFPVVDTRLFRDDGFTTLLGAELHGPALEHGEPWHLLAVGLPLDFPPALEGETGPAIASRAAAAGAFVGIAHPAWYSLTLDDALLVEAAHAVEIYNETTVQDNDRGESWYLSDQLGLRGRRLFAFASDDAHFAGRPDAFGGWTQVRAKALEPEELLAALKAGHFYSSQGPELHDIHVDDDRLHVACSPASLIIASGKGSRSQAARGDGLTSGSFDLERFRDSFCRVTVIDATGKRAWSNPIWLDGGRGDVVASGLL
ncbi:MAG TPA: CehA/McbA family metallohydrolase [Thermomicrobiales bacterium]|nr:CehA/McbA family metallohydrolase [Thermomicrobiales bacterium]